MKQCLMIQTNDNKRFFTYEKNLLLLAEFSKTFGAEISIVQIQNDDMVMELEELAPALCEKKSQKAKYKIIEVKIKPKSKKEKITQTKKIREYIYSQFISGNIVSLKELINKYKHCNLTNACLCNNLSIVRNQLKEKGLVKLGGGKYKISLSQ